MGKYYFIQGAKTVGVFDKNVSLFGMGDISNISVGDLVILNEDGKYRVLSKTINLSPNVYKGVAPGDVIFEIGI